MSHYDAEHLWQLLPAIYRQRDAEHAADDGPGDGPGPLRALVEVLAEQGEVVERDILGLYENLFIETSDAWAVPYLGDLLGVRGAHEIGFTRRAEVADTLRFRRRKGTAAVLEDLARAVTGWPARVVEFFELLATTQHLNHLRPHATRPNLRHAARLDLLGGAFETIPHSASIRPIERREGRYNIPHIGLYLWRLRPLRADGMTPHDMGDGERFTFHPLGLDAPLFHNPKSETSPLHIAEEVNVPGKIRRRAFHDATENTSENATEPFYGPGLDIELFTGEGALRTTLPHQPVPCDLRDWQHTPAPGTVALDPVLGRFAFAPGDAPTEGLLVRSFHAFPAALGSGQYPRPQGLDADAELLLVSTTDHPSVAAALASWSGTLDAVVQIEDSRTYGESIDIEIPAGRRLEIRAREGERPTLLLSAEARFAGGEGSALELDGLLLAGHSMRLLGRLDRLRVKDCTLAPSATPAGGACPLFLASGNTEATIARSILGPLRAHAEATVEIVESIVDAGEGVAYARVDNDGEPGGPLIVRSSTLIGEIRTREMTLGENSLFVGRLVATRRQQGCVRFSYLPLDSITPPRFQCQPAIPPATQADKAAEIASRRVPHFTSLRFGDPGYAQLRRTTLDELRRGAEDGSEMGVFSFLKQPQREDNLRLRLEEYLRFGLRAGVFFVT